MIILALDPSGAFKEGKGQTGWALFRGRELLKYGVVKASEYGTRESYWEAVSNLIFRYKINNLVIENYRLYKNQANSQINSEMETSKLIGYLEMIVHANKINLTLQMATQAKTRFNDKILILKGYISKDSSGRYYIDGKLVVNHIIDAIRHGLYFEMKERVKNAKASRQTNKSKRF